MTALRRDWQEMSIPNDRAAMKWPTVIDCVVVGAGRVPAPPAWPSTSAHRHREFLGRRP